MLFHAWQWIYNSFNWIVFDIIGLKTGEKNQCKDRKIVSTVPRDCSVSWQVVVAQSASELRFALSSLCPGGCSSPWAVLALPLFKPPHFPWHSPVLRLSTAAYSTDTLRFKQMSPLVLAAWGRCNLSSSAIEKIGNLTLSPIFIIFWFLIPKWVNDLLDVLITRELQIPGFILWTGPVGTLLSVLKSIICLHDNNAAEDLILPFIAQWSHWDFIADKRGESCPKMLTPLLYIIEISE